MTRRASAYQNTTQNIAPVIKNFHNCGRIRTESVIVSRLSGIFLRLLMKHTQFFKWTAYQKPYWKCLVKYSAHSVAYFFFKTTRCIGEILVGFQGRWTSIYYFFPFTDFLRSSRYFSAIFTSINFYHVECGDGRQPRILVVNFWIPRSKTRTFSTPGFLTEPCCYFFSH